MENLNAQILLTLSANGPVLIGSGSSNKTRPELPDNTFLRGYNSGEECYVIPGSSIKGVVRHYLAKRYNDKDIEELFGKVSGSASKRSLVSFSDAYADMSTVKNVKRYSTKLKSTSQGTVRGTLNTYEAVTEGDFSCCIRFKKVNKKQIAMILEALDAIENGTLFIGAKTSRGFGKMNVKDFKLVISDGYNSDLTPKICGNFNSIMTAKTSLNLDSVNKGGENFGRV